jgi:hypothetical protein
VALELHRRRKANRDETLCTRMKAKRLEGQSEVGDSMLLGVENEVVPAGVLAGVFLGGTPTRYPKQTSHRKVENDERHIRQHNRLMLQLV